MNIKPIIGLSGFNNCFHGSYNLEKVLNFNSHLEKSFNSVKVLEKSLKFTTLFTPHHFM